MKPLISIVLLLPFAAWAQTTNTAHVIATSGQYLVGSVGQLSCFGQSSIGTSTGNGYVNYGGFIGGRILQPQLDTDGDGIPDELDFDNDNDQLSDIDEITGTPWYPAQVASNPNQADSDGDGIDDSNEAVAGTDPTDDQHFFFISTIQALLPSGDILIEWSARDGKTYAVYRTTDLTQLPGALIETVMHTNSASPPFYVGTEGFVDTAPPTNAFYFVEVYP